MKILYIGDIMGRPGREVIKKVLPDLINEKGIDLVIAQGENLSGGKGMKLDAVKEMRAAGVDAFSGGNHSWANSEIYPYMEDPQYAIVRPANYPEDSPGKGWRLIHTAFGDVLLICVLGNIVPSTPQVDNPLRVIEKILEETAKTPKIATVVDFHGDYSSEKLVVGHFLDGRASLVVGDHWHIPTADAKILPKGTAHITDVGMVGSRDSSLGVKSEIIINRWLSQLPSRNEIETEGAMQFNAVLADVDPTTGLSKSIEQIIKIL